MYKNINGILIQAIIRDIQLLKRRYPTHFRRLFETSDSYPTFKTKKCYWGDISMQASLSSFHRLSRYLKFCTESCFQLLMCNFKIWQFLFICLELLFFNYFNFWLPSKFKCQSCIYDLCLYICFALDAISFSVKCFENKSAVFGVKFVISIVFDRKSDQGNSHLCCDKNSYSKMPKSYNLRYLQAQSLASQSVMYHFHSTWVYVCEKTPLNIQN